MLIQILSLILVKGIQQNSCTLSQTGSINQLSDHVLTINRDQGLNGSENILQSYQVQIVYPWNLQNTFTCQNDVAIQTSCSLSGSTITIPSYFSQNYVGTAGNFFTLNLKNIINQDYAGLYASDAQINIYSGANLIESCGSFTYMNSVSPGALTCQGSIVSTAVVNSQGQIQIAFTLLNSIPIGGSIVIGMTQTWQNDALGNTILTGAPTTCFLSRNGAQQSLSCQYSIQSGTGTPLLTFQLTTAFSAGNAIIVTFTVQTPSCTAPTGNFIISTFNQNLKQLDGCSGVQISGWSSNLLFLTNSCMQWNNVIINSYATLQVNFQLSSPLVKNDIFEITFPSQLGLSQFKTVTSIALISTSGTISSPSVNGQVISFAAPMNVSSIKTNLWLTFSKIQAYRSTLSSSSIIVKTKRFISPTTYLIDVSTATCTIAAQAGAISQISIQPTVTIINVMTSYLISFTVANSIGTDGYTQITFPAGLSFSNPQCNSAIVDGVTLSTLPTISTSGQIVTINAQITQNSIFTISNIKNQGSTTKSGQFIIQTFYSQSTEQNLVDSDSSSTTIAFTPNTIIFTASATGLTGQTGTYTFSFTIIDPITNYILITFPSAIVVSGSTATCTLNGQSISGSISGQGITLQTTQSANTAIVIVISSSLTNINDLSIVTGFVISTYDTSNRILDTGSGGSVQLTQLSPYTLSLFVPTLKTGLQQSYTFTLTFTIVQPSNIYIILTVPSQITPTTTCTSATSCTVVSNVFSAQICPSGCAASSTYTFNVIMTNPISFSPSDSFTSYTIKTPADLTTKVSAQSNTQIVTNNIANTLVLGVQYTIGQLATTDTYTITVTCTNQLPTSSSSMTLTIPTQYVIGTITCNTFSGATMSAVTIQGQVITISFATVTNSQISFTLLALTNPSANTSDKFQASTYWMNKLVDQGSSTFTFQTSCTLPCMTCTTNLSTCTACYTNSALVNGQIFLNSANGTCDKTCANGTYESGTSCLPCQGDCLTCQTTATTCLSCKTLIYFNNKCLTKCDDGYFPITTNSIKGCQLCPTGCALCTSLTVCSSCIPTYYLNSTTCGQTCPADITIPNNITNTCDPCINGCATCQGTTSTCQSCTGTAVRQGTICQANCNDNYYSLNRVCTLCNQLCTLCSSSTICSACQPTAIFYNQFCYSTCPNGLYHEQNTCIGCQSPCSTCSTSSTICASCSNTSLTNPYLLNGKCVLDCGNGLYGDIISARCLSCVSPCSNCNSSTSCRSCITNYNLQGATCQQQCNDYYAPVNSICTPCSQNCYNCRGTISTCISCYPGNYLKSITCVESCGDGYYANSTACTPCPTTCATCSSATICLSCTGTLVLYQNQCSSSCPSGLFLESGSCVTCQQPCATCSTSNTNCASCTALYLLNSKCVSNCGSGYYGSSGLCNQCVSPCVNCSSATQCSSCVTSYLLQGQQCLQACSQYYAPVQQICQPCSSPCKDCSTSITTCLSCLTLNLYNSTCVSTCPDGYYAQSQICTPCILPCKNCVSSTQCTSCASLNLLNQSCVQSCGTGYYSQNQICQLCTSSSTSPLCSNSQVVIGSIQDKYIPIPFTILATVFCITVIVAKIQHPETFIPGAVLGIVGILETCSWLLLLYLTYTEYTLTERAIYPLLGGIMANYLINVIQLLAYRIIIYRDITFQNWRSESTVNVITTSIIVMLSFIVSFKSLRFLYCKYFGFSFLKARMSEQKQLICFNVLQFLSIFICSGPLIAAAMFILYDHSTQDQLFISAIDTVIITFLIILFLIWDSRKHDGFFQDPKDPYQANKLDSTINQKQQLTEQKSFSAIDHQHINVNEDAEEIVEQDPEDEDPGDVENQQSFENVDNQQQPSLHQSSIIESQESGQYPITRQQTQLEEEAFPDQLVLTQNPLVAVQPPILESLESYFESDQEPNFKKVSNTTYSRKNKPFNHQSQVFQQKKRERLLTDYQEQSELDISKESSKSNLFHTVTQDHLKLHKSYSGQVIFSKGNQQQRIRSGNDQTGRTIEEIKESYRRQNYDQEQNIQVDEDDIIQFDQHMIDSDQRQQDENDQQEQIRLQGLEQLQQQSQQEQDRLLEEQRLKEDEHLKQEYLLEHEQQLKEEQLLREEQRLQEEQRLKEEERIKEEAHQREQQRILQLEQEATSLREQIRLQLQRQLVEQQEKENDRIRREQQQAQLKEEEDKLKEQLKYQQQMEQKLQERVRLREEQLMREQEELKQKLIADQQAQEELRRREQLESARQMEEYRLKAELEQQQLLEEIRKKDQQLTARLQEEQLNQQRIKQQKEEEERIRSEQQSLRLQEIQYQEQLEQIRLDKEAKELLEARNRLRQLEEDRLREEMQTKDEIQVEQSNDNQYDCIEIQDSNQIEQFENHIEDCDDYFNEEPDLDYQPPQRVIKHTFSGQSLESLSDNPFGYNEISPSDFDAQNQRFPEEFSLNQHTNTNGSAARIEINQPFAIQGSSQSIDHRNTQTRMQMAERNKTQKSTSQDYQPKQFQRPPRYQLQNNQIPEPSIEKRPKTTEKQTQKKIRNKSRPKRRDYSDLQEIYLQKVPNNYEIHVQEQIKKQQKEKQVKKTIHRGTSNLFDIDPNLDQQF